MTGATFIGLYPFQWIALVTAALALLLVGEALVGHYRKGFALRAQYVPFVSGGVLVALTFWRASLWQSGRSVSRVYLAALAFVSLVMTVQGYLGGELVYRYGVEVEQAYRELPGREADEPPPSLVAAPARAAAPKRGG